MFTKHDVCMLQCKATMVDYDNWGMVYEFLGQDFNFVSSPGNVRRNSPVTAEVMHRACGLLCIVASSTD
jgi:hypothetical protein